jgi:Tfp pilus assembly PilM family ATPase
VAFGMFRSSHSPILVDFGNAAVKLLQVGLGDHPQVLAAATIEFTDSQRAAPLDERLAAVGAELPETLRSHGFRGNRVVVSPFAQHMLVQHMGVPATESARASGYCAMQVAITLGCDPAGLVVRTTPVCETQRDGQARVETIVVAMSREDAMRYVEIFRKCRMQVVGMHGDIAADVHAYDHVNRRMEDAGVTTMYCDLGYGTTKVAIAHGAQLVFAKSVSIAGRSFDARIAELRRCTIAEARAARIAEGVRPVRTPAVAGVAPSRAVQAPAVDDGGLAMLRAAEARVAREAPDPALATAEDRRSGAPAPAMGAALPERRAPSVAAEVREVLEGLADELGMCARYHAALFRDRRIDRVVFLGGEARDVGLCQALAASMRLPAKAGDPLARYVSNGAAPADLPEPDAAHPGWAAVCGLASSPTDL